MDELSRRQFLASIVVAAAGSGLAFKVLTKSHFLQNEVQSVYRGQDSGFLHLLRNVSQNFVIPEKVEESFDCLVIGGGISGLSALYHLEKKGFKHLTLFDAQEACGGNSQYLQNEISKFPLGAHYLPLPDASLHELIAFLQDVDICEVKAGKPIFHSEYLVHYPETKLKYRGHWYDGLIPHANLDNWDREDLQKFNKLIEQYRALRGRDGKMAFGIPVSECSQDEDILSLDQMTCKEFLEKENIRSPFVHWYMNYGTRDDYGLKHDLVSAWAGIHYFASRSEKEDSHSPGLMTWPEGNGFLVECFLKKIQSPIHVNRIVLHVTYDQGWYYVFYRDKGSRELKISRSKKIISSAPHFVNRKIFSREFTLPDVSTEYSPWLTANLSIPNLPKEFEDMPWDSVSYHHDSLGFVRADHQRLSKNNNGTVLTYYFPYASGHAIKNRYALYDLDLEFRAKEILSELDNYYPLLSESVSQIDFWVWGHAMSMPRPGLMRKVITNKINQIHANVYLAHSDYSGISIFEEAFYQGLRAAKVISEKL